MRRANPVDIPRRRKVWVENMTTLAEDMARWICDLRYEELPSEVVTRTKLILLDTMGCALAATDARVFAEALDSSLLVPEVGAEPDGAVTFEWHRSRLG